jgi:hypothetical protein
MLRANYILEQDLYNNDFFMFSHQHTNEVKMNALVYHIEEELTPLQVELVHVFVLFDILLQSKTSAFEQLF